MASRGSVLVVEDEESVGKMLAHLLEGKGYSVHLCADGEEAIGVLEDSDPFLVVITDKNLPRKTGLEVLAFVKQRHPETEVLLMTAFPSLETAIEVLHLGGAGYLVKPFESMRLVLEKVEQAARKAREAQVIRAQLRELEELRAKAGGGGS